MHNTQYNTLYGLKYVAVTEETTAEGPTAAVPDKYIPYKHASATIK